MRPIRPRNQRFRGITLSPDLQNILKESTEQDARDPEDAGEAEVQNRLRQFGVRSVD